MKTLYQILLAALTGACAAGLVLKTTEDPSAPAIQQVVQPTAVNMMNSAANTGANLPQAVSNAAPENGFTAAINKAMPAVVCVSIQKVVGLRDRNFFNPTMRYYKVPAGIGSGFFVRGDGYILTNNHVISGVGNGSVLVTDKNGHEYQAEIIGADPASDLAVIKVKHPDGGTFPTLAFADPSSIAIGQWAIAIGAPFELEYSVTAGIVSSVRRSSVGVNIYENYIQTDASVNPGNSGGPLLNANGDVIGVNDCILTPNQGSIGISFAVSPEIAKSVAEKLIADGHIDRPWLGIMGNQPTALRSAASGASPEKGVTILDSFRDSPADKAGLRRGDVIVSINGTELDGAHELRNLILDMEPGSKIKLGFRRNNLLRECETELAAAPGNWFRMIPSIDYAIPL